MTRTLNIELPVQHKTIKAKVEVEYQIIVDNNYGADIDGNRGIRVEEIEIESIKLYDQRWNDITLKYEMKYFNDFEILLETLEQQL